MQTLSKLILHSDLSGLSSVASYEIISGKIYKLQIEKIASVARVQQKIFSDPVEHLVHVPMWYPRF